MSFSTLASLILYFMSMNVCVLNIGLCFSFSLLSQKERRMNNKKKKIINGYKQIQIIMKPEYIIHIYSNMNRAAKMQLKNTAEEEKMRRRFLGFFFTTDTI